MRKFKILLSGSALGVLLSTPVLADVPPPDACTKAAEGKACDNAGQNADKLGVCTKDTCTRQTPSGPINYECYVCRETAGRGEPNGGSTDKGDKDKGGGCSVSAGTVPGLAAMFAPLTLLGLAAARRRWRR